MPKCPNCKKEIDFIIERLPQIIKSTVYLNEDKDIKLTYDDQEVIKTEPEYVCPNCNEVITENSESAISFLKGENID